MKNLLATKVSSRRAVLSLILSGNVPKNRNDRTISIKDPKLQRVRNNLRLIILKECAKRKSEISDLKHSLTHGKNGKYIKISEETRKALQKLTDKWGDIERPLRASIVKCPICSRCRRSKFSLVQLKYNQLNCNAVSYQ